MSAIYNGYNSSSVFNSLEINGMDAQPRTGAGFLRYNTTTNVLEMSNNKGAWLTIGAGSSGGIVAGTNIQLSTVGPNTVIGTTASPTFTDVIIGSYSLNTISATVTADLDQSVKVAATPTFADVTIGGNSVNTAVTTVIADLNQAVKTTSSPSFVRTLVTNNTAAQSPVVQTNNGSAAIVYTGSSLAPNLTAAQRNTVVIGQSDTLNNAAVLDFIFASTGSTGNQLTLGFSGNRDLLKLDALGAFTGISSIAWNNGLGALSVAGSDATINATNNLRLRCAGADKLVITSSTGDISATKFTTTLSSTSVPGLNAVNLATGSCTTIWSLASSLATGNNVAMYHGVSGTGSYNASIIQFNYNGLGSATNTLGLGFFGANNRWLIDGSGNTTQTGDSTSGRVLATNNTGTVATIAATNNAVNSYIVAGSFLTPNMTGTQKSEMYFGQGFSTNNCAVVNFNYTGSGSTANTYGIGFYGANNKWTVDTTGQTIQTGAMVAPSIGAINVGLGLRAYNLVIDSFATAILGGLRVNGTSLEFHNGTSWINASTVPGTNLSYSGNTLSLIASPVVTDITVNGNSMNTIAGTVIADLNQAVKTTSNPTFASVITPSVTSSGANDLFLNAPSGRSVSLGTNSGARITAHDTYVDHWARADFWSGLQTDYVSPHGTAWTANAMILGTGYAYLGNLKMNGSALQYHDGSAYQTVQTTANTYATYFCQVRVSNVTGTYFCTLISTPTGGYNIAYGVSNTSVDITFPGTIGVAFNFQWCTDASRCTVPTGISGVLSGSNVVRCIPSYATTGAQTWNNVLPNTGDFLTFNVFVTTP